MRCSWDWRRGSTTPAFTWRSRILGATVMPHNLYLHSALVQTRRIGKSSAEKREACRFNLVDSVVALNGALIVNAAILVLAAAVFFTRHKLWRRSSRRTNCCRRCWARRWRACLFAVALLASGQSSTLTGTYAGQIVMEGFLDLRMRPWMRRLITRTAAIIPGGGGDSNFGRPRDIGAAAAEPGDHQHAASVRGDSADPLHQRPAAHGRVRQSRWVRALAWATAAVILGLNLWLVARADRRSWAQEHPWRAGGGDSGTGGDFGVAGLDHVRGRAGAQGHAPDGAGAGRSRGGGGESARAGVSQDTGAAGSQRARPGGDRACGVSGDGCTARCCTWCTWKKARPASYSVRWLRTRRFMPARSIFTGSSSRWREQGVQAELTVPHGASPKDAIVKLAKQIHPDLIVMGAHGHRGVKDLIFGNTINGVRHEVSAPVLVVGDEP